MAALRAAVDGAATMAKDQTEMVGKAATTAVKGRRSEWWWLRWWDR